jgi:hypothetical protein
MRPKALLPVLCLMMFAGCSTPPQHAPAEIPPPPTALLMKCPTPDDLPDVATARELAEFAAGWVRNAACERSRSFGLIESWPR